MSQYKLLDGPIAEARRQLTVCNACRYCEGFCSVFPAVHQLRHFSDPDVIQLANLCHNCRACHFSCQFSEPHEYEIKLPQALADVRVNSYLTFTRPRALSNSFQKYGLSIAALLVVSFTFLFWLITSMPPATGIGFYAVMSHSLMVLVFAPAFLLPLISIGFGLRDYWKFTEGKRIKVFHLKKAIRSALTLKDLSGGQGQGCNFEQGDKYSNLRRYYHQASAYGFLLCFASTTVATFMHYLFAMPAPYAWYTLPKLFGLSGGILLVIGCGGLARLKLKSDPALGVKDTWGAEMAFIVLLGLTGFTGLVLYALTGSDLVKITLTIHLAFVLTLFLLLPFSKMVHGFYRMAALVRHAQNNTQL